MGHFQNQYVESYFKIERSNFTIKNQTFKEVIEIILNSIEPFFCYTDSKLKFSNCNRRFFFFIIIYLCHKLLNINEERNAMLISKIH